MSSEPLQKLFAQADACLMSVFKRLISFASGRTIVVPLSGGLDSRLIILMLRRIGYDNAVAFAYGRKEHRESRTSKKMARKMGFTWEFVEYSNSLWRRSYESPEWQAYSAFADGLSSTPHLQDWPAVWELKREGRIPDESIFVPGLIPATTHSIHKSQDQWLTMPVVSADQVAEEICDRYFTLQDWSACHEILQPAMCGKIKRVLQLPPTMHPEQAFEAFGNWWLNTVFSNFLVNSVRAYEFWGYEWWLPLCDAEAIQFWSTLPLHLQLEKRFELPYVRRLEKVTTGKAPEWNTSDPSLAPILIRILNMLHLRDLARRVHARSEYDRHHFRWYGLLSKRDYMRSFHGKETINTYIANQTLRKISPNYAIPEGLDFLKRD
ncbi:MAG TPA: asparagine synthase C-terminal domain-containing protein [Terriglobales bacterium]|nr:asparagine synthase C-terminal domain-containing protein [Terriglobales bacterium]